jgi:hypothetical protein
MGGWAASGGHAARGGGRGVRPAAGPGRGGAESSSAGAGERRERGGGPVRGKWPVGWPGEIRKKKKKENGLGPRQQCHLLIIRKFSNGFK